MSKNWGIIGILSVALVWLGAACSTEPEYQPIKTVDQATVNNGDAGNSNPDKPRVSTNSSESSDSNSSDQLDNTSADAGQANEDDNIPVVGVGNPVDLNFTWDAPVETDISSYKIYSRMENQAESLLSEVMIANLNLTAPSFTFQPSEEQQSAWQGKTVYFSIVASNPNGDSEKSMEFPLSF